MVAPSRGDEFHGPAYFLTREVSVALLDVQLAVVALGPLHDGERLSGAGGSCEDEGEVPLHGEFEGAPPRRFCVAGGVAERFRRGWRFDGGGGRRGLGAHGFEVLADLLELVLKFPYRTGDSGCRGLLGSGLLTGSATLGGVALSRVCHWVSPLEMAWVSGLEPSRLPVW